MVIETELRAVHDSRESFYGKARVIVENGALTLRSYETDVAFIDESGKKATVKGTYSATTLRHIKEFLIQNGFEAKNAKQIMADYGEHS